MDNRKTGEEGNQLGLLNYHFHPLHEHLDIDRAFTEKNPRLHRLSDQT